MQNVSAKNKPCAVTIVLYLSKLYTTIASRNTILDIIKQRDTWDSNSPPYNCGETPMTTESPLPWPHDSVSIREIFALIDRDNFQFLQLCKTSACMLNRFTKQTLLVPNLYLAGFTTKGSYLDRCSTLPNLFTIAQGQPPKNIISVLEHLDLNVVCLSSNHHPQLLLQPTTIAIL